MTVQHTSFPFSFSSSETTQHIIYTMIAQQQLRCTRSAVGLTGGSPARVPAAGACKPRTCIVRRAVVGAGLLSSDEGYIKPDATVPLPDLKGTYLTDKAAQELSPVISQAPPRQALVDIYYPAAAAAGGSKPTGAVIFAHAFVQPSYSYPAVIKQLQSAGYVVVAPTTDVFDIIGRDVGLKFDQKRADVKMQSTLQSALIIDILRTHQMLQEDVRFAAVQEVVFMGHSLGGACSIIAAAKVQSDKIRGVAVMSPEVREMQKTPVNDDIWLLNGDADSLRAAMEFFKHEFPADTPLALISSKRDSIARPEDLKRLFVVATEARQGEDVALFSIDGNHFGYENELDLPNRINFDGAKVKLGPLSFGLGWADKPFQGLVNAVNKSIVPVFEWLQYKAYFLSPILGNSPLQEPENLQVLSLALDKIYARQALATVVLDGSIALQTQPTPQEVARVLKTEPADNTTPQSWLNALLGTYAGLQLLNSFVAFNLLQESYGGFETRLGLVILASLSFNLFYENSLLVAGRSIGGSSSSGMQLLQELSKWRFLAHSGAPLALIAGLNMAGRAGVEWAANPYWEGLIGLLILAVVGVSSVRNSFFLEITPVWNRGILRFSYAPGAADFTKIIPVIVTTLVLVILGWQSYQRDAELLPFFVGPLVAFVLNALPASKDGETGNKLPPQFVLGNGGEVALFAGMVATEVLLHMQGK
ncbi:hypothetical protein OEZ85_006672 [Tetradesmus obliquus]|uniref:1-alkyl-2-acetylglycerophosphocholine esterase n=1 Tax=Tetradesmus obliquus TaxID=3088 RepID=A0ABY8U060_TETOB|nr:hypothetical protein OEZ85_006672 [Tetradesmus obliquus]